MQMATKLDIQNWIIDSLKRNNGSAYLVQVTKDIWLFHETDLRSSGDLFYPWQYDMRWAANALRRNGISKPTDVSPLGIWELV